MISLQSMPEPSRTKARDTRWLSLLENELRSRIGWTDEAVSPFARSRRTAQAQRKVAPTALQTGKAA